MAMVRTTRISRVVKNNACGNVIGSFGVQDVPIKLECEQSSPSGSFSKSFQNEVFALALTFISLVNAASIYLVGDSTMADHASSEGIEGWGVYFPDLVTLSGMFDVTGGGTKLSSTL
jgi:hypothetical protein